MNQGGEVPGLRKHRYCSCDVNTSEFVLTKEAVNQIGVNLYMV